MPESAESGTTRAKATAEEEERRLSAAAPTCDNPFAIAKQQSNFAIALAIKKIKIALSGKILYACSIHAALFNVHKKLN